MGLPFRDILIGTIQLMMLLVYHKLQSLSSLPIAKRGVITHLLPLDPSPAASAVHYAPGQACVSQFSALAIVVGAADQGPLRAKGE